jgi:hypothetical protein
VALAGANGVASAPPGGQDTPVAQLAKSAPGVATPGIVAGPSTPDALKNAPFCPDCGADKVAGAKFCGVCGCSFTGQTRAKGAPPSTPPIPAVPAAAPAEAKPNGRETPMSFEELYEIEGMRWPPFRPRTTGASAVDDPAVLQSPGDPHADPGVGLQTTHPVGDALGAALVDEPATLAGTPDQRPGHLVGALFDVVSSPMASVDDVAVILAAAPTLELREGNGHKNGSLAAAWADAAERPIPRKDAEDRNEKDMPASRAMFIPKEPPPEPPPVSAPEPSISYQPAVAQPPPAAPAPWAAFASAPSKPPEPAPEPKVEAPVPGVPPPSAVTPTMLQTLDAEQLRKILEREIAKGHITADDLDGEKKKP